MRLEAAEALRLAKADAAAARGEARLASARLAAEREALEAERTRLREGRSDAIEQERRGRGL